MRIFAYYEVYRFGSPGNGKRVATYRPYLYRDPI